MDSVMTFWHETISVEYKYRKWQANTGFKCNDYWFLGVHSEKIDILAFPIYSNTLHDIWEYSDYFYGFYHLHHSKTLPHLFIYVYVFLIFPLSCFLPPNAEFCTKIQITLIRYLFYLNRIYFFNHIFIKIYLCLQNMLLFCWIKLTYQVK